MRIAAGIVIALVIVVSGGCTKERQNEISRSIQNWTGTDGVLEIYAGNQRGPVNTTLAAALPR